MTNPTTTSLTTTSPTKESSRRTYASYSASINININITKEEEGTPSTAATNDDADADKNNHDSPSSSAATATNKKDLSVLEMTRDLFQSQESKSAGKSSGGIDWSLDSDGEDNNNNDDIDNENENPAQENDGAKEESEKETELLATQPSVTKPTIANDSDTASMSSGDNDDDEDDNDDEQRQEEEETPETSDEKEVSKGEDASETVESEPSSELVAATSEDSNAATNALKAKDSASSSPNKEQPESDSDDDATVAMDLDDEDDEATRSSSKPPSSSLFDVDLSDEDDDEDNGNAENDASSDDKEEESSKLAKRGRAKRKQKQKQNPVKKTTIPEDSESEQEFDDAMPPAAAAAAEKEQPPPSEEDVAEDADTEDNGQRRSRRTPKKRNLEFVPTKPSPRKTSSTSKKSKDNQKKKKNKKKAGQEPAHDSLITSTDYLFLHADKTTVTVKDILKALEAEYDCKLSKSTRKFVRFHLVSLMSGEVEPSVSLDDNENDDASNKPSNEEEENVGEDEVDSNDDEEDQISEQGDVESEFEADEEDNDDDFEAPKSKTKKSKNKKSSSSPKSKKVTKNKKSKDSSRSKPKRPNQRKAAKAAKLVEAMRLRKKRMEELRVRNEEMQLNQTKEDQARAEKIAAKLDTNTDELRMQRLEDRLDLLGKLDQRRIVVLLDEDIVLGDLVKKEETKNENSENAESTDIKDEKDGDASKLAEEAKSSEEESSDDEDLVIVGATKRIKPMAPLSIHVKASAIDVLNRIKSPDRKQQQSKQRQQQQKQLAPANNVRARSALRNSLKQKQRAMGNTWLARELGYKTEQEHLKDCEEAANKKRGLTILREQQRIQANERKQLRERLIFQEAPADDDDEENEANLEESSASAAKPEEEDEEMQMAKEIEQEHADKISPSTTDDSPAVSESGPLKNTESQESVDSLVQDTEFRDKTPIPDEEDGPEDFSPDFSQEDEAQPLESPQLPGLPDTETQDEVQRLETQPPGPAELSVEHGTQEETQRLETQIPPSAQKMPPPAAVVREVTAEPGKELSQLSDGVDKESFQREVAGTTEASEESADIKPQVAEGKDSEDSEDDGELEFVEEKQEKPKQDRNAGWKLMLQKEAEKYKKQKRRKGGNDLVEQEAEEEEEEEVAGLEDFGFSIKKKRNGDDEDEDPDSLKVDDDDLEHVVDDVSDGEGDEEAGRIARKKQEQREEKERHKDMIRRMREGYDGRRGGIAGSGVGARGMHRFDQLVAADNREDAKRLGLLNADELDSDDENNENKKGDVDDEDDEAKLLDSMLKDRFLHRSNVELENFSDDEDEGDKKESEETKGVSTEEMTEASEERTQERLAKRFAKRARMCRLEEQYADSQEFSQQRMIDEDESMKKELSQMKNGLVRNRSTSSRSSISSNSNLGSTILKRQRSTSSNLSTSLKRQKSTGSSFGGSFLDKGGSLSVALRGNRSHMKRKTSFLGGDKAGDSKDQGSSVVKNVALSHVVFKADSSRSSFSNSGSSLNGKRKLGSAGGSFFRRATGKNQ